MKDHVCGILLIISRVCSSSVISLKVSPAHQSSQTLIIGKPGEIRCGIEGKAAQVLWRKVGMKHRLRYSRVRSSNSKTLSFRRVQEQDAGQYVCHAISMSGSVKATVNVSVEAAVGRLKLLGTACSWNWRPHNCRKHENQSKVDWNFLKLSKSWLIYIWSFNFSKQF